MRLRPSYTPPDEPTPVPGLRPACPHCGQSEEPYPCCLLAEEGDANLYRRFVFSAQVLGLSLLALAAITLVMFAWVRVFAGH